MFRAIARHPLLTIFLVLAVALAAATARKITSREDIVSGRQSFGTPGVIVAPVSLAIFIDELEALGTATANESVAITAKVTETVRRVNFSDGMEVEKGAILVELTNAEEQAQLAEYRANLAEAEQQFDRIAGLVQRGNAAESVLDERTEAVDTAKARIDGVRARLDDRLIRAPFAGILGFRRVSPGTLVTPNAIIATLDDISVIKLDFPVPEIFIAAVRPGQEIEARSAAYPGMMFSGVVTTVNSRVDPATRAVTVRAVLPNDDHLLKPGMLLSVVVFKGSSETLVVPEQALVPVQNRQFVFVVGDDNVAERREVKIGRRRPGKVEILDGLKLGERVITEGAMKIRSGNKVRVLKSGGDGERITDAASTAAAMGQSSE